MKGRTVILDAGHGGVINGVYQTPGKRSPGRLGPVIYEGELNRFFVSRICEHLSRWGIPYIKLTPEDRDTALRTRVERVTRINNRLSTGVYLVSIHCNAGGGFGFEVFTTPGKTYSDSLATKFYQGVEEHLPDHKLRTDYSDGDKDKEQGFYILRKTACPAVLLELAFMDHPLDYKKLRSMEFREKMSFALAQTIANVYTG